MSGARKLSRKPSAPWTAEEGAGSSKSQGNASSYRLLMGGAICLSVRRRGHVMFSFSSAMCFPTGSLEPHRGTSSGLSWKDCFFYFTLKIIIMTPSDVNLSEDHPHCHLHHSVSVAAVQVFAGAVRVVNEGGDLGDGGGRLLPGALAEVLRQLSTYLVVHEDVHDVLVDLASQPVLWPPGENDKLYSQQGHQDQGGSHCLHVHIGLRPSTYAEILGAAVKDADAEEVQRSPLVSVLGDSITRSFLF
ncbi:hypothetical protein EYF80_017570 [Liparis tanakae]|uniref:Uncharacterized protein n=1 Tax=Liparis tanakae TaxID=230148 RepID=A0A4Z2I4F9_9TELE|nr:hypothetical protein EYF80_017570 [Liparis tanakae]